MGLLQQIMQRRQNHKDHEPVGEYTLVEVHGRGLRRHALTNASGRLEFQLVELSCGAEKCCADRGDCPNFATADCIDLPKALTRSTLPGGPGS
jgi:hypothetical protein